MSGIDNCALVGKLGIFDQDTDRSPREFRKGILRPHSECFPEIQVNLSFLSFSPKVHILLPTSFQARIGNMDGVLVAYHNTARIFGFQYVSLEEMEEKLYGSGNGTRVFNKCVSLLERVLSDVVSIYGERVGFLHPSFPSIATCILTSICRVSDAHLRHAS